MTPVPNRMRTPDRALAPGCWSRRVAGSPSGGFTLLEILIALAIAGIVVASLFAVYDRTLEVGEQLREQAGLEQSARMIFMQLHRDLDGLYYRRAENATEPGPYSFFGAEGLQGRQGTDDTVTLLRLGSATSLDFQNATFPEHGLFQVRYLLRRSSASPMEEATHTLLREQIPFPEIREDGQRIALSDNVRDVSISFVSSSGGTRPSWNSASRNPEEGQSPLPRSVVFEMTLETRESSERVYRMQFAVNGSSANAHD